VLAEDRHTGTCLALSMAVASECIAKAAGLDAQGPSTTSQCCATPAPRCPCLVNALLCVAIAEAGDFDGPQGSANGKRVLWKAA